MDDELEKLRKKRLQELQQHSISEEDLQQQQEEQQKAYEEQKKQILHLFHQTFLSSLQFCMTLCIAEKQKL